MSLSLPGVPTEVLGRICDFLDHHDICSLRLTARGLEVKTVDVFGRRVVSTINHLMTTNSVERLLQVSKHATFRHYVREIRFLQTSFNAKEKPSLRDGLLHIRKIGGRLQLDARGKAVMDDPAFQLDYAAVVDHLNTIKSPKLQQGLTESIAQLPELRTITFAHDPRSRVYLRKFSRFSNQDPLGLASLAIWPDGTAGMPNVRELALGAVLRAIIANPDSCRIEQLDTCGDDCLFGIAPSELCLSDQEWQALERWLPKLKKLHLCLAESDRRKTIAPFRLFPKILAAAAPYLESLYLAMEFPSHVDLQGDDEWAEWKTITIESCFRSMKFSHLTELQICGMFSEPTALEELLRTAAPNLRVLRSRAMGLLAQPQYAPYVQPRDEVKQGWRKILDLIRDNMQVLQLIDMDFKVRWHDWLGLVDRWHGPGGTNELHSRVNVAFFDASKAKVELTQWLDELEVVAQPLQTWDDDLSSSDGEPSEVDD